MNNTSSDNVETQKRTGKVYFFVHLFIVLSVAIMWLSVWYNSMFIMMLIFGAIITIPILIAALVSLYFTLAKKQWGWKVIISLHGVNFLLFIFAFTSSGPSAFSMEKHYESHKNQMMDLVEYTHKAVDGTGAFLLECDWLLHLDENMPSSAIMDELGLTQMELDAIVMLLKKTGCKGIILSNSARVPEILYQREGMGAFYYRLRMPDSPLEDWVNVCSDAGYTSTTYTDSVLFEYGSGAIGSMSFPNLEDYEKARPEVAERNRYYRELSKHNQEMIKSTNPKHDYLREEAHDLLEHPEGCTLYDNGTKLVIIDDPDFVPNPSNPSYIDASVIRYVTGFDAPEDIEKYVEKYPIAKNGIVVILTNKQ